MAQYSRSARRLLALALLAGGLVSLPVAPASAHVTGGAPTSTDYVTGQVVMTDGTPMKVRILKPAGTPPAGGWPLMLYYAGSGTTRCHNIDWYTRDQLARDGFIVLSVNPRGMPRAAGSDAAEKSLGCDSALSEQTDALNDGGADFQGPTDVQDGKDLISWAIANVTNLNAAKIGAIGSSYFGGLVLKLAGSDNRIDATVSDAASGVASPVGSVTAVTNKPLAESVGLAHGVAEANNGWSTHSTPDVLTNVSEAQRTSYFGLPVPTATRTWWNARTTLDDDGVVDQTAELATPTFVVQGFRDVAVMPQYNTELWKKLVAAYPSNKYLYVGACGHGVLCGSTSSQTLNAATLRGKIHSFLDKHVVGDTISMGGPVFFAVPPVVPVSGVPLDNWTLQTALTWPPTAETQFTNYFRQNGALSGTAPTTGESASDSYTNPLWMDPPKDVCLATQPVTGEFKDYTSDLITADGKLVQTDFDLVLSSATTRLQVAVQMFEVPASGPERAVWAGTAWGVPTARGQAAGTKVRFTFKSGSGYTFAGGVGNKIRIRVASHAKSLFAPEPYPTTYTLYHNPANTNEQSKVTWHIAT